MSLNKIIITGGPGTGKSTLINALRDKGYCCFDEMARQVIKEEMAINSTKLPWLDMAAYSDLVFDRIVAQVSQDIVAELIFCDRSVVDVFSYLRFAKCEIPDRMLKKLPLLDYAPLVFLAPFWEEIYRTDQERKETPEMAKAIEKILFDTYQDFGFTVKVLPKLSVAQRIAYILEHLA